MKYLLILLLFCVSGVANIFDIPTDKSISVKGKYARNKKCVRCHLDIYKEFKYSKHHFSNILNNPAHKAMWDGNPLSKEQKYVCASCHAPAAEDIDALISGAKSVDPKDKSITDGISCAFCHRIEDIHPTDKGDKYVVSKQKRVYFGTRESKQRSDFHKIKTDNPIYKNGNVCLTCHAHHKKQKLLILREEDNQTNRYCVFSKVDANVTEKAQNTKEENCITCHMPQVEGSFTDRFSTPTHAYHGFKALSTTIENSEKYIDINLTQGKETFNVILSNKMPHDLLLHPTRLFKLKIYVNDKLIQERTFQKESRDKQYKPLSWLKENVRYPHNLLAKNKITESVKYTLQPGDKVHVVLGYYVINPDIAKKVGLNDEKSTTWKVLREKTFTIKP
jgi:nitrate reductase cytochrome c-type subunit